jgi:hypothetical protein
LGGYQTQLFKEITLIYTLEIRKRTKQWPLAGEFVEFEYSPKIRQFCRIRVLAQNGHFGKLARLDTFARHSPTIFPGLDTFARHSPTTFPGLDTFAKGKFTRI